MAQLRPRQISPTHRSASSLLSHHSLQLHERTRQAQLLALQGARQQVLPVACSFASRRHNAANISCWVSIAFLRSGVGQDTQRYIVCGGRDPAESCYSTLQRLDRQSWLGAGAPPTLSDEWVYKDPNGQLQVRRPGRTCACCLLLMAQLPGTHAPLQSTAWERHSFDALCADSACKAPCLVLVHHIPWRLCSQGRHVVRGRAVAASLLQGPFSKSDILDWYDMQYFPSDLQVKHASQPDGAFEDVTKHIQRWALEAKQDQPQQGQDASGTVTPQEQPQPLQQPSLSMGQGLEPAPSNTTPHFGPASAASTRLDAAETGISPLAAGADQRQVFGQAGVGDLGGVGASLTRQHAEQQHRRQLLPPQHQQQQSDIHRLLGLPPGAPVPGGPGQQGPSPQQHLPTSFHTLQQVSQLMTVPS